MDKNDFDAKAVVMSGTELRPILDLLIDRNLPTELLEMGLSNPKLVEEIAPEILVHPNLHISSLVKVALEELEVPNWVYRMCTRQLISAKRQEELNVYCKHHLDLDEGTQYPVGWLLKMLGVSDILR